jgi:hypothetical protein
MLTNGINYNVPAGMFRTRRNDQKQIKPHPGRDTHTILCRSMVVDCVALRSDVSNRCGSNAGFLFGIGRLLVEIRRLLYGAVSWSVLGHFAFR